MKSAYFLCLVGLVVLAPPLAGTDVNGERVDGLINYPISDQFDVFVHLRERPTEFHLHMLAYYMHVRYVSRYFDIVGGSTTAWGAKAISSMNFVTRVEIAPIYYPMLHVSARSVRARNDTFDHMDTYSPKTAWDLGYDGTGIIVAILDTGIDDEVQYRLDDLDDDPDTDDPKFIGGYNAVTQTEENPDDEDGHGTHVAGVVMGTPGGEDHDAKKYIGVAPKARLVDVRVANDDGSVNAIDLQRGLEWCIDHRDYDWDNDGPVNNGIDIILMSLGTDAPSDGSDTISQTVNQAVQYGLVVIAAMGNDNTSQVPSPAAADLAIAVGGCYDRDTVNRTDDRPYEDGNEGTNRGPRNDDGDTDHYDELKPDVSAPAQQIESAEGGAQFGVFDTELGEIRVTSNGTQEMSGTSIAAAHVAGIAALMLQANPDIVYRNGTYPLKEILRETAEMRGKAYNRTLSRKYNTTWGYGYVDAYGAVRRSLELKSLALNIPSEVDSNYNMTLNVRVVFTTTEFTMGDRLEFYLEVPQEWPMPGSINIRDSGIVLLKRFGTADNCSALIADKDVIVRLNLSKGYAIHDIRINITLISPMVGSLELQKDFTFRLKWTINGNYSVVRERNVTVSTIYGSVSGRVLDMTTHRPIKGVRVSLTEYGTSTVVKETYTGPDGFYILEDLREGRYDLKFWKKNYLRDENVTNIVVSRRINRSIEDVYLVRSSTDGYVSGKVTDGDNPLENVLVEARAGENVVNTTRTDVGGGFLMALAPGSYWVVASKPGFDSDDAHVTVQKRKVISLELTLSKLNIPGLIYGTVKDDQGVVVNGAKITVLINGTSVNQTHTDPEGNYRMYLDEGAYTVRCSHQDYETQERELSLSAGQKVRCDFTLKALENRGWIEGNVMSTSGEPLPRATITAYRSGEAIVVRKTYSSQSGNYKILLEEGIYDLKAEAEGHQTTWKYSVSVSKGTGITVDFILTRINSPPEILSAQVEPDHVPADGATLFLIKVHVNDADGLDDIASVTVDLTPLGGSISELSDDGTLGDEIAGDGIYTLEATVARDTPKGSVDLDVTVTDLCGRQDTSKVTLTVEKAGEDGGRGIPGLDASVFFAAIAVLFLILNIRSRRSGEGA